MNFSGIPRSSYLGKLLRLPLCLLPRNAVVPILQGELRGYKWIVGSASNGFWLGSYEHQKQKDVCKVVRPGTVAFDIGAHVGYYTLLFSRLAGHHGHVFAFEPHPQNVHFLEQHISLNHISNATILDVAVSGVEGMAHFQTRASRGMGHLSASGDIAVRQVAIDTLIDRGELPPPQYIKMDIEGEELNALHGAEATLRKGHPAIFLATHGPDIHAGCCEFLRGLGYTLEITPQPGAKHRYEVLATQ